MSAAEWIAQRRGLLAAATEGPWYWRNTQAVYLFGARSRVVMAFERMGMQGAQPVFRDANNVLFPAGKANLYDIPDARLIADARTSLPRALNALEAALDLAREWEDSSDLLHPSLRPHTRSGRLRAAIESALRGDS